MHHQNSTMFLLLSYSSRSGCMTPQLCLFVNAANFIYGPIIVFYFFFFLFCILFPCRPRRNLLAWSGFMPFDSRSFRFFLVFHSMYRLPYLFFFFILLLRFDLVSNPGSDFSCPNRDVAQNARARRAVFKPRRID